MQNLIQAAREKHVVEVAYADVSLDFAAKISSAFPGFECRTQAGGAVRVAADEPVRVGPLVRFLEEQGIEADVIRKEKEKTGGPA